jgi:hypothetical protein
MSRWPRAAVRALVEGRRGDRSRTDLAPKGVGPGGAGVVKVRA